MAQSDLLKQDRSVTILAIESSCDETSAAVVVNGRDVLSNVIFSQIDIHKVYGGVVPEIASRSHIEKINQVIREALDQAQVTLDEIDAVAVTYGPGLVGPLLVGVSEAKGGHTHLVYVADYTRYEVLARTRDDAAGEAFDKVARAIGLPYPGGVQIDQLARKGDAGAISFPKAHVDEAPLDFSFSGLKSAVLNYLNQCRMTGTEYDRADLAAGFQKAERPRRLGEALFIGAADRFLGLHVRERFLHQKAHSNAQHPV